MARGRNTALRSLTERKYSRRSPHGSTARYSVYDRRESMARWDLRFSLVVAASLAVLVGLVADLALDAGRPYPGFFAAPDFRLFPAEPDARAAGLGQGDRLVAVDGASPLTLAARVRAAAGPIRYEVERAGRRFSVELAPRPLTWSRLVDRFAVYFLVSAVMLIVGAAVYAQNPAAAPNRRFLLYMCLWAVSNVAVPEAVLGARKYAAALVGLLAPLLSIHGWVFFLTYPANADRERWLERHRVIPRLYRVAVALGLASALSFLLISTFAPALLVDGWVYPASAAVLSLLSTLSFPIKVGALLDTRRRAASPLVNQQTTVLLLGIGMGLGAWLCLMLWPLQQLYGSPFDPQVGSALMLLYPVAIGYATVRYRLFDASVVIRRSVIYTGLAGLITGAYALLLAGTNALLAQTDLTRSPWFSAGFMFVVVLLFNPLRERVRRAVDRTFFRERHDNAQAMRTLARSMSSLLDLDEITRRLTTTIESSMHVRATRLLVDGFPHDVLAALEIALRALLVLGGKRSEAPYTGEDLEMLEALADQAAVAVANAEAHRQVLDYAQQLERSLLIRGSLAKFVPRRVRQLIEESPEAPSLEKRETDVSVLFADISGYTRLSSRLPPDDLASLVERYFGAFLDEIVKHGGVNTGPALLGATKIEGSAGTRWTYTASGMTTNIAARLAAQAGDGEIVISEATRTRLGDDLLVEDLGVRELKNVETPMRLFRLR